jgi:hypothetical protein
MYINVLSVLPPHELLVPLSRHISAQSGRQMTIMCTYSSIYEEELKPP